MLIITVASSGDQARDILRFRRYLGACDKFPGSTPVRFKAIEGNKAYIFAFRFIPNVDPDQVTKAISEFLVKDEKVEYHEI